MCKTWLLKKLLFVFSNNLITKLELFTSKKNIPIRCLKNVSDCFYQTATLTTSQISSFGEDKKLQPVSNTYCSSRVTVGKNKYQDKKRASNFSEMSVFRFILISQHESQCLAKRVTESHSRQPKIFLCFCRAENPSLLKLRQITIKAASRGIDQNIYSLHLTPQWWFFPQPSSNNCITRLAYHAAFCKDSPQDRSISTPPGPASTKVQTTIAILPSNHRLAWCHKQFFNTAFSNFNSPFSQRTQAQELRALPCDIAAIIYEERNGSLDVFHLLQQSFIIHPVRRLLSHLSRKTSRPSEKRVSFIWRLAWSFKPFSCCLRHNINFRSLPKKKKRLQN